MKIKTSLSLDPEVHSVLKRLADKDRRSMSNFLEMFIEGVTRQGGLNVENAKKSSPSAMQGMSLMAA